jgi:hypothetical protein
MRHKKRIPKEVEDFIVERLACYDSPEAVAVAVKTDFDLLIGSQVIEAYDPTTPAARNPSDENSNTFQRKRARFLKYLEGITLAHRAVRLGMLGSMATAAEERGDFLGAAKLLEQIAREVGGVYRSVDPVDEEREFYQTLKEITERNHLAFLKSLGKTAEYERYEREIREKANAAQAEEKQTEVPARIEDIPFAYKAVRVRMLSRMATKAEEKGHSATVAKLLQQIAKEMGGVYGDADLPLTVPPELPKPPAATDDGDGDRPFHFQDICDYFARLEKQKAEEGESQRDTSE